MQNIKVFCKDISHDGFRCGGFHHKLLIICGFPFEKTYICACWEDLWSYCRVCCCRGHCALRRGILWTMAALMASPPIRSMPSRRMQKGSSGWGRGMACAALTAPALPPGSRTWSIFELYSGGQEGLHWLQRFWQVLASGYESCCLHPCFQSDR